MFDRSPIPTVRPGRRRPPAAAINRLGDAAARGSRSRPGPGLLGLETPAGLATRKPGPATFHARLSGSTNPYAFVEVYGVNTAALWATLPDGRGGGNAYALNGTTGLDGQVVELTPVAAGLWYRFNWRSKSIPGSGMGGVGTTPFCFCTAVPEGLEMISADETCNFNMFQSCTITYQPVPAAFAGLGLTGNIFTSYPRGFPDPAADNSIFYYYLTCQYNQYSLTRLYVTSPYGSPFRDAVLYSWLVGSTSNTCGQGYLHLNNGTVFPGNDASCSVTINGGRG